MRRPSSGFLAMLAPILLLLAVWGSLTAGGCEDYGGNCVRAFQWVGALAWCALALIVIELLRRSRRR